MRSKPVCQPAVQLSPCPATRPAPAGWAIEGAIGSEYKIDASYLSPHVNMASRLEAATKQYGATILMSEEFVRMLSPGVRCAAHACPAPQWAAAKPGLLCAAMGI